MKLTLVALAMLPLLLAAACGNGERGAAGPTATASRAPVVGPVLVYVVGSGADTTLAAYDAGARRELRRIALPRALLELPRGSAEVRVIVSDDSTTSISAIDPTSGATRAIASLPVVNGAGPFLPSGNVLSPDGTLLAFSRAEPGSNDPEERQVGVVDVATGAVRVLATLPGVSDYFRGPASIIGWRDDGRGVLVEGTPGGPAGTWADVMLDGSVIGRLHDYGWASPSGRAVAMDGSNDVGCVLGPVQQLRIWDMDANANTAEVDDPGQGMQIEGWSPDGSAVLYRQYRTGPGIKDCLPDFDVGSKRWFLLESRGGAPVPVPDVAALRRLWNHGHDLTFPCADGDVPDMWGRCAREDPGLAVDGQRVEASGAPRVLGWIDVPHAGSTPSASAGATPVPALTVVH